MLDTIARKILPIRVRQALGYWSLVQAGRNELLLKAYLWLVHGYNMKNLRLLSNNEASYNYMDCEIIAPRDGIGSFFEVFQKEVYDKILKIEKGNIVIDVGAYVGMFSIKASTLVGLNGLVIAVEPDANNFKYLQDNILRNAHSIIKPVSVALSDRDGIANLYLSKATACHSLIYKQRYRAVCTTTTLDSLLNRLGLSKRIIDFIKIDAEGAEVQVLEGARETLKFTRKVSVATYHELPGGKSEMQRVRDILTNGGFEVIQETGLRGYTYAKKSS